MSTPFPPQHHWMEWLVDMQVASCGCGSPVCLHTSQLGTAGAAMFAQTGDDSWKTDIDCYKCGKKGHLARECPKKKTKEAEQMHADIAVEGVRDLNSGENIFFQSGIRGVVNRNYVLLNNQITVDQIVNPSLLSKIRKAKNPITVHCNNGSSYTNLEGNLGGMTVYHEPRGQSGRYDHVKQPIRHHKCPVVGVDQGQTQGNIQQLGP